MERAHDAVGDVEEGQAAGLAAGVEQAPRKLRADHVEDLRRVGDQRAEQQLVQALVADLGQLARRAGAQRDFAPLGLDEQAHLADELAGAEIAQHQLAAVVFLGDDADRAVDDVVQRAGRIAGAEDIGAGGIAAAVALREEALERGGVGRQWAGGASARRGVESWAHGRSRLRGM